MEQCQTCGKSCFEIFEVLEDLPVAARQYTVEEMINSTKNINTAFATILEARDRLAGTSLTEIL